MIKDIIKSQIRDTEEEIEILFTCIAEYAINKDFSHEVKAGRLFSMCEMLKDYEAKLLALKNIITFVEFKFEETKC